MTTKLNLSYIKSFFTKGNERTLRAKKNIVVSFICKGLTIIINFIIVPLTLNYVGKVEYGIWITISAIIQWFTFFDIGLGNGLRNKLAEALARNNLELARTYISSVYAIISGMAIFLFGIFFVSAKYISWNKVLNTNSITNESLSTIVIIVFFFFCLSFVLNLLSSILHAMQKNAMNDIINLIAQIFGLGLIYFLVVTTHGSLFYLCVIYGSKTVIVMLLATIILFSRSLKDLKPRLKYVNIQKALPLFNLGIKFFIAQILYLIVTQTSLILVAQFFGPEDVTTFNLAVRYMTITSMVYLMILTPFLAAFTEAYSKNEFGWIKITIKRINWIWGLMSLATIIMIFCYGLFFRLWVGETVKVPLSLILGLAVSGIIGSWGATYSLFLNSLGKLRIQLYLLGAQSLLFFPLSYLFYYLGFGLVSIVVVQIIFNCSNAVLMTVQYNKIILRKASGIWLK